MTTGNPETPLADKLSLKRGMRAWFHDMPESIRAEINLASIGVAEEAAPSAGIDAAHIFVTDSSDLKKQLAALRGLIQPAGHIWVSWPNETSGVASDITEDAVRELAVASGLVDTKACAVDERWSGLKLVIRRTSSG